MCEGVRPHITEEKSQSFKQTLKAIYCIYVYITRQNNKTGNKETHTHKY